MGAGDTPSALPAGEAGCAQRAGGDNVRGPRPGAVSSTSGGCPLRPQHVPNPRSRPLAAGSRHVGRGRASAAAAHTRAALAGRRRIVRRERGVPEPLRRPPRQEDRARRDGGSRAGSGLGTAVSAATAAAAAAAAAAARRVRHRSGPRGPGAAQPAPALLQPGRGGEDLGHRHLRGAGARRCAAPARALLQVGGGAHRLEQRPYHPGKVPGPSRAGSLPARASPLGEGVGPFPRTLGTRGGREGLPQPLRDPAGSATPGGGRGAPREWYWGAPPPPMRRSGPGWVCFAHPEVNVG